MNKKRIMSLGLATSIVMSSVVSFAEIGDFYRVPNYTEPEYRVKEVLKSKAILRDILSNQDEFLYEGKDSKAYDVERANEIYMDSDGNAQEFLERLAKEDGIVVGEDTEEELKVISINAVNRNFFNIEFNKSVDLKKDNIEVKGLEVKSVEISEDGKLVKVSTSDMGYGIKYDVKIKGLAEEDILTSFVSNDVEDSWTLEIEAPKAIIADGISTEVVKFRLLDSEGNVDEKANDIVLDLNATFGNLSQKRLTMQKGYGEVILRSEFNEAEVVSKLDAQIIEASGDYKDLIGKVVAESAYVVFNHDGKDGGEEALIKSLVSVNSNEADRVTLIFDEPIVEKDIYELDKDGDIVLEGKAPKLLGNIKVSQDSGMSKTKDIKHIEISKKNPKAVIVYLDVRGEDKVENILRDNSDVYVSANIGKYGNDKVASFKLTDTRVANLTGVEALSNKKLKITFSEGILESDFVIDGRHSGEAFELEYGDITEDGIDERHVVILTLTDEYQEPDKKDNEHIYPKGYFKPGKHSIQASSIKDFAAHSDDNNIGTTQTLAFEIEQDKTEVSIEREVHSPEQFLIKFDREVEFEKESKSSDFEKVAELVFKNKDGKWETVKENIGNDKHFKGELDDKNNLENTLYVVKDLEKGQYLIEMTTDWTVIYDTEKTKDNYYNDEFAVRFAKGTIVNPANGKSNSEEIIVNLSDGTALAKPDTTSPVINEIKKAKEFDAVKKPIFDVTMSEPVKLADESGIAKNKEGATLARGQESLPETKVEFLGKDKDGKTRTFIGKVNDFKDPFDKVIEVQWINEESIEDKKSEKTIETPQTIVDEGGDTNWTLVIRSISDDIGNTAATVTADFELEKSKEIPAINDFRVNPEGGSAIGQGSEADKGEFAVKGEKVDSEDIVKIEFTQEVSVIGRGSAVDVKNYNLNGKDLPAGTKITIDDEGKKIIISLPAGTLGKDTGVITLAAQLESKEGQAIKGDLAFTFKIEDKTTEDETETELDKALEALKEVEAPDMQDVITALNEKATEVKGDKEAETKLAKLINEFVADAEEAAQAGKDLEELVK